MEALRAFVITLRGSLGATLDPGYAMAFAVGVRVHLGVAALVLLIARTAAWQPRSPLTKASISEGRRSYTERHAVPLAASLDRQGFLRSVLAGGLGSMLVLSGRPQRRANAADLLSDEYEVVFDSKSKVGLSLADFGDKGKYRTYVKGVIRGSQAEGKGIKVPALVVSVNGVNVEGLPASYVVKLFKQAEGDELRVVFRDPAKFIELLTDKGGAEGAESTEGSEFSTQLAPETKAREAQVLTVRKTEIPEICGYGAKYGDLLEIAYSTSLEDGTLLDSSGITNRPGRGGDTTLYFVLGQQPVGQFPKGWDIALTGSCVGERRQIRVPPVLAYGPKGLKKRGIPPDSTLIYDILVIGINGNNLPR